MSSKVSTSVSIQKKKKVISKISHYLFQEAGRIVGSKHFQHVCGGRGRSGLALMR